MSAAIFYQKYEIYIHTQTIGWDYDNGFESINNIHQNKEQLA